jgi:hypothetical protein
VIPKRPKKRMTQWLVMIMKKVKVMRKMERILSKEWKGKIISES